LIEIVPHIAILWASVAAFGAVGAATAMLIVTALDACLLMAYARMPLWRAAYFWQGATWIAVASLAGLWFDAANPWRYGADAALVGGAIFWALRLPGAGRLCCWHAESPSALVSARTLSCA
jgi:hypothetical protein